MQERDFQWFVDHQPDLFKQYGHSFIAIKNRTVLGAYPSYADAVKATQRHETLGTFIVQECTGDESAYTAHIIFPISIESL